MARTAEQQVEHLERQLETANEQADKWWRQMQVLSSYVERLRTELEIIQGAIGIFGQDEKIRKATNADWMAARIAAALEATQSE